MCARHWHKSFTPRDLQIISWISSLWGVPMCWMEDKHYSAHNSGDLRNNFAFSVSGSSSPWYASQVGRCFLVVRYCERNLISSNLRLVHSCTPNICQGLESYHQHECLFLVHGFLWWQGTAQVLQHCFCEVGSWFWLFEERSDMESAGVKFRTENSFQYFIALVGDCHSWCFLKFDGSSFRSMVCCSWTFSHWPYAQLGRSDFLMLTRIDTSDATDFPACLVTVCRVYCRRSL